MKWFDGVSFHSIPIVPVATPAFIVTIYGDVVEPRGGALWMGGLVDCCGQVGISETLVRTAVSRMVSAGKLKGQRIGRRSYYSLTDDAKVEFQKAEVTLYSPPPDPLGWFVALQPPTELPPGWVQYASQVAIAPRRSDLCVNIGPVFSADIVGGLEEMREVAEKYWDLASVAARYDEFLSRFEPLRRSIQLEKHEFSVEPQNALALRLLLVHCYRVAALKDPRLPQSVWPARWRADEARRLFVQAYLALTGAADTYVGRNMRDANGILPTLTAHIDARIDRMRREWAALASSDRGHRSNATKE